MSVSEVQEQRPSQDRPGAEPLVKLVGVKKHFPITRGIIIQRRIGQVHAVDGVDLEIYPGETVGLLGETGCGKSTIANSIMRLLKDPAKIAGGSISFGGKDVLAMSPEELRRFRWQDVAMVFQTAMS